MSIFKNITFLCLKPIMRFWHYIYSYNLSLFLQRLTDKLYTFWISNNIKKIDNTSTIGRNCYLIGGKYIEIGSFTTIGKHGAITCWERRMDEKFSPSIKIGNNCSIGDYCHITSTNSIIIGNGVLTGRRITITDNSHGKPLDKQMDLPPLDRKIYSKGPVVIEDNVWIGDKACIMPGVRIGKGAIIGANAVVTKNVPSYAVVGGIPAEVLKKME